jgi:hypothetical protein
VSEDFDQTRALAQHFIRCYTAARQGLSELGILRSERNLQGDYAEWLAAGLFGLQLVPNPVQKGFDAHDARGLRYQIKSRMVKHLFQPTSFDFAAITEPFDYLVCAFFSPSFELLGLVKVTHAVVRERGVHNAAGFRFRWNRRTAGDARIERIIWSQTSSETSEVGDLCLSFSQRQAESGRLCAHRGALTGTAPLGIFFGTQLAKWGAMVQPSSKLPLPQCGINSTLFVRGQRNQ